jgi:hypothetical protein
LLSQSASEQVSVVEETETKTDRDRQFFLCSVGERKREPQQWRRQRMWRRGSREPWSVCFQGVHQRRPPGACLLASILIITLPFGFAVSLSFCFVPRL